MKRKATVRYRGREPCLVSSERVRAQWRRGHRTFVRADPRGPSTAPPLSSRSYHDEGWQVAHRPDLDKSEAAAPWGRGCHAAVGGGRRTTIGSCYVQPLHYSSLGQPEMWRTPPPPRAPSSARRLRRRDHRPWVDARGSGKGSPGVAPSRRNDGGVVEMRLGERVGCRPDSAAS
jgi:hypothetical protein